MEEEPKPLSTVGEQITGMRKEAVISELKNIEQSDGVLTADAVVAAAEGYDSPLHPYFDWNDSTAAAKYRKIQARFLINSVKVQLMGRETEGFFNARVLVDDVEVRGYVSAERVLSENDLRDQVIKAALRELTYWQEKYKYLDELKGVVNPDGFKKLLAE